MQPKRKEALVLWIHTSLQASSPYLPTSPQRKPNKVFLFFLEGRTKQSFSGAARFKLSMSNQQYLFPYEIKKNFCGKSSEKEHEWVLTGLSFRVKPADLIQTYQPPLSVLTISNTTPLKLPTTSQWGGKGNFNHRVKKIPVFRYRLL